MPTTTRRPPAPRPVLLAVLVSGAFLTMTRLVMSDGRPQDYVFVSMLGVLLLWLVLRRRSGLARGFIIVTSLLAATVHLLGLSQASDPLLAAVAFLGQALPLLTPAVRRHVRQLPAAAPRVPVSRTAPDHPTHTP